MGNIIFYVMPTTEHSEGGALGCATTKGIHSLRYFVAELLVPRLEKQNCARGEMT